MNRTAHFLARLLAPVALLALSGCATVTNDARQRVNVQTVDADGHVVEMSCKASHGPGTYFGNTPMFDLQVRRSPTDLVIECHKGKQIARATVVSRGMASSMAAAILPGGSASIIIDQISGYGYSYPEWIQLRIGQELIFDASRNIAGRPTPGMQAEAR